MASGEAEPLQYTTTALRVSIHCEGCKKKVKKVLHSIEGVYKVTLDAAQHKVTVTGNVEADALVRRLHKAGKQAALWPSPAPAPAPVEAKKPEEAAPAALPVAAGESCAQDAADAKLSEEAASKEKPPEKGDGKEKPAKDKKAEKGEAAAKPNKDEASKDAEAIAEPKEKKGSPEPAKQDAAEKVGAEEPGGGGGKKGKKNKKNKPKDGGEGEAPAQAPAPAAAAAAPAPSEKKLSQQPSSVPDAFPYYAAPPVLSYNVAHPSSSVSYYAPTPVVPMHPMPSLPQTPQMVPYGYPPYPAMVPVPVPAEFLYGPPGVRSSPPQESYNNMFNEDNANSCSLM